MTFKMISNWKKPFGFHGLYKRIQRLKGQPILTSEIIAGVYLNDIHVWNMPLTMLTLYSAGIDFNLTSKVDPRTEVKLTKELTKTFMAISNWKIFWSPWFIQNIFIALRIKALKYFNPFKPEFTIVIFIHYKPRIAVAILDL